MPFLESIGSASAQGFGYNKLFKPSVTGGTLTSDATYYYRTFTANGTLSVTGGSVEYQSILVAGGGGGNFYGGGAGAPGGAGGFVYGTGTFESLNYLVQVGSGGAANLDNSGNGSNSQFNTHTAIGGGMGPNYSTGGWPITGGSGGGAIGEFGYTSGGLATVGQGNAGGSASSTNSAYPGGVGSGGGGGASAVGSTNGGTRNANGGNGGNGTNTYSSWATVTGTGASGYYAGGGGGGAVYGILDGSVVSNGTSGTGGLGGGGNGGKSAVGKTSYAVATAGTANTGGGGGGGGGWYETIGGSGSGNGGAGRAGGSGIVIIRYLRSAVGG